MNGQMSSHDAMLTLEYEGSLYDVASYSNLRAIGQVALYGSKGAEIKILNWSHRQSPTLSD